MTSPTVSPLPLAQRIALLDVLRGFALMGILIMNMPGFGASFFAEADGSHLWPDRIDQLAELMRDTLFSGKFNSMFSLLFGIGFTIQFQRMQQVDPAGADSLYLRRLAVLWVIGLVHACVFWTGDVLHVYALLGLLLLYPLRRVSDRAVVVLIVVCLLFPALSGALRVWLTTPEATFARVQAAQAFERSNNLAFGGGGFFDTVVENTRMMVFFYGNRWTLWGQLDWYVMMSLTMLLGLLCGRRRWVHRSAELLPQVRRAMWVALVLGLVCGAAFALIFDAERSPGPSAIKVLGSVCYGLSRVSMMAFYVLLIVRLAQRPAWQRRFAPLAAAGRMPLTNYLVQTAICITLFDAWGFGWWLTVGPAAGLLLALLIFFAVQVPWSLWWLSTHERGPVEALWARLTYGAKPSARQAARI